jgi:hypothetical protein
MLAMIDAADVPCRAGRLSRVAGCWPRFSHGGIMRIRRTIIAPVILTIGALGSLVAAPAVAALTSSSPAASVASSGNAYYYHA